MPKMAEPRSVSVSRMSSRTNRRTVYIRATAADTALAMIVISTRTFKEMASVLVPHPAGMLPRVGLQGWKEGGMAGVEGIENRGS